MVDGDRPIKFLPPPPVPKRVFTVTKVTTRMYIGFPGIFTVTFYGHITVTVTARVTFGPGAGGFRASNFFLPSAGSILGVTSVTSVTTGMNIGLSCARKRHIEA